MADKIDTVEKILEWKTNDSKEDTVEFKNKTVTDRFGWRNTDVLYSFLGIYVLGLLAYYPDEYYLSNTKYTVKNDNTNYVYKTDYIKNSYLKYSELNEDPFLKMFIGKYFTIGNVIPIWPGGNSDRGTTSIYDIPEIYLKKYPEWTEALVRIYNNAEINCVIDTTLFFNTVKRYSYECNEPLLKFDDIRELLTSIEKAEYSRDVRIYVYQLYLQRIIGIIETRETALNQWINKKLQRNGDKYGIIELKVKHKAFGVGVNQRKSKKYSSKQ